MQSSETLNEFRYRFRTACLVWSQARTSTDAKLFRNYVMNKSESPDPAAHSVQDFGSPTSSRYVGDVISGHTDEASGVFEPDVGTVKVFGRQPSSFTVYTRVDNGAVASVVMQIANAFQNRW